METAPHSNLVRLLSETPRQHPVMDVIHRRAEGRSQPGRREDGYRVALAIEGGGMRGVVTAGMVTALEQLGLRDSFDAIYGTSAGSITGAYFIAGQAAFGTTIFYDFLTSRRFISSRRLLRGRPIMSHDYLINEVMANSRPLSYDRVLHSSIELHICVSSVKRLMPIALPAARSKEELQRQLRASALIPLIAGDPVPIGDDAYCDAGIYDSIPWRFAEAGGATHTLVLQSRPLNHPRRSPSFAERVGARIYFGRVCPGFLEPYSQRVRRYNEDCGTLVRLTKDTERAPALFAVSPAATAPTVRQKEQSRDQLLAGAISGFVAAYEVFTGETPYVLEMLAAAPNASD